LSLGHLTLPMAEVERTARFLQKMLGYLRDPAPANSPVETVWLAMGGGQQMHIVYVEDFVVSPFEGEFGRHIAILVPAQEMIALRERLAAAGAQVTEPLRICVRGDWAGRLRRASAGKPNLQKADDTGPKFGRPLARQRTSAVQRPPDFPTGRSVCQDWERENVLD
jgi:hypothetical protein